MAIQHQAIMLHFRLTSALCLPRFIKSNLVFPFMNLNEKLITLRVFLFLAPVYMGLNFTNAEDTTEVVAFVSPNKARFFTLSAEHFYGVEDIYIDVRCLLFVVKVSQIAVARLIIFLSFC